MAACYLMPNSLVYLENYSRYINWVSEFKSIKNCLENTVIDLKEEEKDSNNNFIDKI